MNTNDKKHVCELVWRILGDIGSECEGVDFRVEDIFIENQTLPALFIKWNPKGRCNAKHCPGCRPGLPRTGPLGAKLDQFSLM